MLKQPERNHDFFALIPYEMWKDLALMGFWVNRIKFFDALYLDAYCITHARDEIIFSLFSAKYY